jgi:NADPH:quinone reductase-like Zn-dependent oxidoreductase
MRAAVVERVGEPPAVSEIEPPQSTGDGTLVAPRYGTLNPIEIRIAAGREGAAPEVPYVPGVEGVGRVVRDGAADAGSAVRFECRLPGRGSDGCLAQLAVAEPDSLVALPEGADEALAAAVGVIGITADLALDAAEPIAGARVLVLGASGSVGRVAVQLAKRRDAERVVAAGRDPAALRRAVELGADVAVELPRATDDEPPGRLGPLADELREAAGGPIDVVVDPLWGAPGAAAVMALADGGRSINVGQAAGAATPPPLAALRNRRASLIGLSSGWTPMARKRRAYERVLELALAGSLDVDLQTVPMAGVAEAWERQAGSPHAKLVIEVGAEA